MTIREKISKWLIKNKWLVSMFWIIMGVLVEKSCNKIIPEDPIVIKEISDTIKFVHTYDFGITNDSLINIQLQNRLKNIEMAAMYEKEFLKHNKNKMSINSIMIDASFPNAKGYSPRDATPYFSLKLSSLQNEFIDFDISFINANILEHIYCLSLKIFLIEENKRVFVLDENYNIKGENNLIRITNTLSKGTYEFCVGFTYKKDRNAIYPNVYQLSRIVNK